MCRNIRFNKLSLSTVIAAGFMYSGSAKEYIGEVVEDRQHKIECCDILRDTIVRVGGEQHVPDVKTFSTRLFFAAYNPYMLTQSIAWVL